MIAKELLDVLCCPENKEDLSLIDDNLTRKINDRIAAGGVKNRGGQPVVEKIDGGLIRKDQKYVYPIREKIPILLVDEAFPMGQFS